MRSISTSLLPKLACGATALATLALLSGCLIDTTGAPPATGPATSGGTTTPVTTATTPATTPTPVNTATAPVTTVPPVATATAIPTGTTTAAPLPTLTPTAVATGTAPATPGAPPPKELFGLWQSASCGQRTYARDLDLKTTGDYLAVDLVSPCPKGTQCVWSGIVSRQGKFSVSGKTITFLPPTGPADTRGQAIPGTMTIGAGNAPVETGSDGKACVYTHKAAATKP